MKLDAWEKELEPILTTLIPLRRELHRFPELGGHEVETKRRIMDELTRLGLEVCPFDGCCGVMGILRNGEGACVGVRADMDALPITERSGLPFSSEHPGVMHACGHDMHMTIALGSAAWLSTHRDAWHGTVKYFFEPEEETTGGGRYMVAQGCMENPRVDVVLGQHVNPSYEAGVFFSKPGYVSGSSDELSIRVTGSSAHGAYPERGADAIVMAGQIVTALQTLVSRTISPFDPAVITIGTIEGGTANNIICGEVRMRGTIRTLSPAVRDKLHKGIHSVAEGIAVAMGGAAEVTIRAGYGAVCNDEGYHAVIEQCAEELLGKERMVRRQAPSLGVESVCFFMEHTPGVYYDMGSGIGTALHTDTFKADEAMLVPAIALQCEAVMKLMNTIKGS